MHARSSDVVQFMLSFLLLGYEEQIALSGWKGCIVFRLYTVGVDDVLCSPSCDSPWWNGCIVLRTCDLHVTTDNSLYLWL